VVEDVHYRRVKAVDAKENRPGVATCNRYRFIPTLQKRTVEKGGNRDNGEALFPVRSTLAADGALGLSDSLLSRIDGGLLVNVRHSNRALVALGLDDVVPAALGYPTRFPFPGTT